MNLSSQNLVSIFTGAVSVDILFLVANYLRFIFVSERLTEWYTSLRIAAVSLDVIIIAIVVSLGVEFSHYAFPGKNLGYALLCVLFIQVIHDILFYFLFKSVPRGRVYIFDIFKDYADEVRYHAIWSDSFMVILALFIAEAVSYMSEHSQKMTLISVIYIGLFALYSKPPTIATTNRIRQRVRNGDSNGRGRS